MRGRHGLLLVVLIISYLMSALFTARWIYDLQVGLFTVAVLISMRNSPLSRRLTRIAVACLVLSVPVFIAVERLGGGAGRGAASIWTGLLMLTAVLFLIRQVLLMPAVTLQSIYGAISAYLVIGLMFAAFYAAMYWLHGQRFFAQGSGLHTTSDFQYFSFTTLTTLGYGDLTAASSAGRALAMLEAMTGQIFLATLVARLVSVFRPARAAAPGPTADPAGDDR